MSSSPFNTTINNNNNSNNNVNGSRKRKRSIPNRHVGRDRDSLSLSKRFSTKEDVSPRQKLPVRRPPDEDGEPKGNQKKIR